jgi:UDP-N-acetylglucosamine--N-acetylmuramyl-(pentapeptide) pyrophosphoryl-undecaprenol N-acetylglucosamine transferase
MKEGGIMADTRRKAIILTGGGSAGHVTLNLTLLPDLLSDGWEAHYIGSRAGIEATLARREGLCYHTIQTGKLRRYFDIKNLTDPFRFLAGIVQSMLIIAKVRPFVIFSKGGFVATPVVIAGGLLGVPSVIHESDRTQGLANRLCAPFASRICLTFGESYGELPEKYKKKAIHTGAPIRPELREGIESEGYRICGFNENKPVLLAIGGSQGSAALNRIVRSALPELLKSWQVAHICGKGNALAEYGGINGYAQFEYAGGELAHIYKISRAAVSRAGSNTIFELAHLAIPSVLIPLPLGSSRGDQIVNATEFEKSGYCIKLDEGDAEAEGALPDAIARLVGDYERYREAMLGAGLQDSKSAIMKVIRGAAKLIE